MSSPNHKPKEGDTIVVWFSCGAASAVALKKTIEKYHNLCTVRAVNNFIVEEDADNRRFLTDVENWCNIKIEQAFNSKYPTASIKDVFEKRKMMSTNFGAPCTVELKKGARYEFEKNNKVDWHVLGYPFEEWERHFQFYYNESPFILPVLIDCGLTKDACFEIISQSGIALPRTYSESSSFGSGYPNANCIGCVKASSPTYWNHVRETRPEIFKERAEQSRRLAEETGRDFGFKLVRHKGKRIFLDELPADAKGRSMKTMNIECGIICPTGEK